MRQQSSIRIFFTTAQLQTHDNAAIPKIQHDTNTPHNHKQDQHLTEEELYQGAVRVQTTLDSRFGDKLDLEQNNDTVQ
eukprot:9823498-Ditylum_brightwellii.AAC.1